MGNSKDIYSPDLEQGKALLERIKNNGAVYDANKHCYICWDKEQGSLFIRERISLEEMLVIAHNKNDTGETLTVPDIQPMTASDPESITRFLDLMVMSANGLIFDATRTGLTQLESLIVSQNLCIY